MPSAITLKQFTNALARADLTSYCNIDADFNSFYVSLCVYVAVSRGVFMSCDCRKVPDDFYLSFYLVSCMCSKVLK